MVKIVLREVLLRKLDLPCSTLQCLAVARATLTAVSALVRRPDCWKKLADVVHGVSQWSGREYCRILCLAFFFHEYGRRVGMVPRSSLKGGKNSQMVEKGTEKPNTTPNKQNTTTQGPEAESPPSCSLFSVQGETCETRKSARKGPELKNEKHIAGLCSSKVAKRLQKDFTSPL